MKELESLKNSVLKSVKILYERGLTSSLSGNVSVKAPKGFIITPSGIPRWAMTMKDLIYMDFEGNILEGTRKPSIEWRMHKAIYLADEEANAIVHAHPKYTLALSLADHLEVMEELAEFRVLFGKLVVVPYEEPGSEELASKVQEAVRKKKSRVLILERHGAITVGKSPESATALMEALEEVAKTAYLYLVSSSID
ncbi:MAG: class II aldolase/adducin family protein [Thermoprotei archaeon]|nr:MAG: class II aldolase/adducin family protein [Thermoprotei archaeon]